MLITIFILNFILLCDSEISSNISRKFSTKTYSQASSSSIIFIEPIVVINHRFKNDHRNSYKLRFNPSHLYDYSRLEEIQGNTSEEDDEDVTDLDGDESNNYNVTVAENSSTNSSTNIMKPKIFSKTTLQQIRDTLQNLLYPRVNASTVPTREGSKLNTTEQLKPKGKGFLNLFNVVKFENSQCMGMMLNGIRHFNGTCYHRFECDSLGGLPLGSCANGYGVCCVFKYGCGMITRQEVSYFETPKYPLAMMDAMTCVFTVEIARGVKQILLEFLFFELHRPIDGECIDDRFTVSGQSRNYRVPTLCGINTGQHLYIDVRDSPERKLYLSSFSKNFGSKAFSIKITQLQKHEDLAPEGCLQYHKHFIGFVKSFNYEEMGNIIDSIMPTYLNNLNYAICIKRASEKCAITYSNVFNGGDEMPFQMLNVNEEQISLIPRNQAGAGIFNCPDDFILINAVRLCGEKMNDGNLLEDFTQNAPVHDAGSGPITLYVRTNSYTVGRGFKINYYQENC